MTNQEEYEKKISEAKMKFVNGLPGKISEIVLIWNHLNKNEWRTEIVAKMQALAHNIAGTAGTLEFTQLGEQAKSLELSLERIKLVDTPPDAQLRSNIDDLLISLQEMELATIRANPTVQTPLNKSDVIYILDEDRESSIGMSRQLMYYGCSIKVVNSISELESNFHGGSALLIIIDADFAKLPLGTHTVIETLRKDWLITCPVIYISKHDDFDKRMNAIKSSADAFFTKPLDIPLAIERIHILTNAGVVEPYRILIVEDDADLAGYYAAVLERGGMKVHVETKPELALSKILQLNPELVVMDLYMPNYNGIEVVKMIRQHQSLFTLPIVLLTGETDVNMQFLAREVGVDDYIQKPVTDKHLFESVLNRVQRARYMNISMAKDSLTGLYVHKKINEFLDVHLNICARYDQSLAYTIFDVDNFKDINDTYGHLAGDNVLIALANLIKTNVRSTDFVGRYGGEEFVIISPNTDAMSAFKSVDRLRKMFSEVNHYADNKVFTVTFSAGIASFPKCGDQDMIMAVADKALYQAKDSGRNMICIG